jgi:hypothetical protein
MSASMPPSGANPPVEMLTAEGLTIELAPMAREICRRYGEEFRDEHERSGPAAEAWCLHDNQYLLAWAIQDARDGTVDLVQQALWLADVLDRRGFSLERLARDLEITTTVAEAAIPGAAAVRAAPAEGPSTAASAE